MVRQVLFILLLVLSPFFSAAQSDSTKAKPKLAEIELKSGKEYQGNIVRQDQEKLRLRQLDGTEIEISLDHIASINFISELDLVRRYAQTRYFFAPNAFSLKKGEAYYQNAWIFFNQVSVGLSDNFTLGMGTVPLFLFDPEVLGPLWITPKLCLPVIEDKMNVAVGGLYGTILGENVTFGITYASATFGNIDNNATVSIGYGVVDGEWADLPTFAFSGMVKAGHHTYLVTENYYIDGFLIMSFGGRTDFRKLSLDYGLMVPGEFEGFFLPWLGVTVPFKFNDPKKS